MKDSLQCTLTGKLRACLGCSQIKTQNLFRKEGCENCPVLKMKGSISIVNECTSSKFKGMIALLKPENSWVAKWQRINDFKKGVYAMTVEGILPDDYIRDLEKEGRIYHEREESFKI